MNTHLLSTQWQRLPERTLRKLQVEKLRHYLRDTVIPFSAHYREMFQKRGIKADSIRVLEDLEGLPFTSKTDLLSTPENSQKARDFVLIPKEQILAKRPSTIVRALFTGRANVKARFEREFRPIFLTSTTGRSADPIPFLSSPIFGQSNSMLNLMLGTGSPGSGLAPIFQAGGARSVRFVFRFRF